MTLAERSASYAKAFPKWPAPRTDARWLDGVWVLGNDYRNKSRLYADPPYEKSDAKRYGVKLPHKKLIVRELAEVVVPGGFLVWLDTSLPMFRKAEWEWFGAIAVVRSTNHRVRLLSIFRRVG